MDRMVSVWARAPLGCHASGMEGGTRLALGHRARGMGLEGRWASRTAPVGWDSWERVAVALTDPERL